MAITVFDLFKIGIGPSSSYTVGPMRAARQFVLGLQKQGLLDQTASITIELFGSLGATGKGHGSDTAVILGLEGETPEEIAPASIEAQLAHIHERGKVLLLGQREIPFQEKHHLKFQRRSLPYHPNGMQFTAWNAANEEIWRKSYYSVGSGFVVDETATGADRIKEDDTLLPYPFKTGGKRGGNRDGAQPGLNLRSGGRAGPNPLHRTQRSGVH